MARPRKNAPKPNTQELSLVPVEEQPYPLPEGWKWVRLGDVAHWGSGGTPSRKIPSYYNGTIPWIKTGELMDDYIFSSEEYITEEGLNNSSAKIFPKDTVIIAMYGATIGKTAILGVPASTNQACACATSFLGKVKYLFYYLHSEKDNFIKKAKGGAQPNISQDVIKKCLIPLPPLDEQERIVTRIESLFAKLDEAKEKAESVLDSYETRKAAILHKAFTGELTAKWRGERGIKKESWKQNSIASLCHSLKYGTAKKSKENGPVVVLRMGNLQAGEIDWGSLAYSDDQEDIQKYLLTAGDVLFNRTNSAELVGKTSIYRGEYPAIYAGYLIKMDYKKDVLTGPFLNYVMNSQKAKAYCNAVKSDGVNQSNINAKKLGAFIIPVPPLPEQQEITRILDSLLEKEQQSKEVAETVLEQIDLMKKAILAKAFRGELG